MNRKIRLAKVVSLIACVLAAAVWVSTYFQSLQANGQIPLESQTAYRSVYWGVSTSRGEIRANLGRQDVPLQDLSPADRKRFESVLANAASSKVHMTWYAPHDSKGDASSITSRMGFEFSAWRGSVRSRWTEGIILGLPLWLLCVLFVVLPGWGPVIRLAKAVRAAPRAKRRDRSAGERIFAVAAVLCLAVFGAIHVTLWMTRSVGWSVRFSHGTTFVELAAQKRDFSLTLIRNWPDQQPAEFLKKPDEYRLMYPFRDGWLNLQVSSFVGVSWSHGNAPFFLDEDGTVSRLPFGKDPSYMRALGYFPYQQFRASIFELALLAGVAPAWWVALGIRRRVKRFKAVRDSLCGECGYSLARNLSGVCPECGAEQRRSLPIREGEAPAEPNPVR